MNVERIRQLADHLRAPATAAHFDIDNWLCVPHGDEADRPIGEVIHTCGTVACIAGHAVALFRPTERFGEAFIWDAASKLLGLTTEESTHLFLPHSGPTSFDITAEQAAAVLDHLADTGEIDWLRAPDTVSLTEGAR